MHISSYGITHQGKVRRSNQDAFLIDDAHNIFAVADGLGGLPGGAEASTRIIELIKRAYKHIDAEEERADLSELVIEINRVLRKEGNVAYPATGFGSTLTMNQVIGDQLFIAHVGDSATSTYMTTTLISSQLTIPWSKASSSVLAKLTAQ